LPCARCALRIIDGGVRLTQAPPGIRFPEESI